jgi:hypothetical protein
MSPDSLPFPAKELETYLKLHGWNLKEQSNERIHFYATQADAEGAYSSLVIPTSEHFSDYRMRIMEAIGLLAEYERHTVEATILRVRSWDKDILRARVFSQNDNIYNLPLDAASDAIAELKKFVGYAAYTETEPKPFFDKAGGVSKDFTGTCRFGHTFEGSFGFNIECPLSLQQTLPLQGVDQYVPFERNVMDRIATGLNDLRSAIENDDIEQIVQNYHLGFNANMCRAMEDLYKSLEGRRIEYNFLWCPEVITENTSDWHPFIFEGRAFEFICEAARRLESVEDQLDSLIKGRVVQLKSEVPPGADEQGEFEHLITMFWEREKGSAIKIRVPLTPSQYQAACDAHRDGRRIKVRGVPTKKAKFWELTKPHDFSTM